MEECFYLHNGNQCEKPAKHALRIDEESSLPYCEQHYEQVCRFVIKEASKGI